MNHNPRPLWDRYDVVTGFVRHLVDSGPPWTSDKMIQSWLFLPFLEAIPPVPINPSNPLGRLDPHVETVRATFLCGTAVQVTLEALRRFGRPEHVTELKGAMGRGSLCMFLECLRLKYAGDLGCLIGNAFWCVADLRIQHRGPGENCDHPYNAASWAGNVFAYWALLHGFTEESYEPAIRALQRIQRGTWVSCVGSGGRTWNAYSGYTECNECKVQVRVTRDEEVYKFFRTPHTRWLPESTQ